MAKIEKKSKKQAPAEQAGSELDVLLPERDMIIQGETVTIHPFNLRDTLLVSALSKPLIDAIAEKLNSDTEITVEDIMLLLAEHSEITEELAARSVRKPVEWVAALTPSDGLTLLDLFWQVNRDFFTAAAFRQMGYLRAKQARAAG